ncbi:MAG: transglutaminase domain-containing protein [Acutalibacteraceae bacterium]|jgi:transglutaminase/protease-like cytokinesis protein 3
MKIIKGIFLIFLIAAVFLSSSYALISSGIDKTVVVFYNLVSEVESYIMKMSRVTEVQYEEYYELEPEFDAAYNSLNNNQKQIYKKLYAISQKMPDGYIKLLKKYDNIKKDVAVAYNALLYDRAEIFWMPRTYILSEYTVGNSTYSIIAFNYESENVSTSYTVPKAERAKMQKKLDEVVEQILKNSDGYKGDFYKEQYFNDYLCENVEYVRDGLLVGTAYGALVENKAQCEGYSKAFKLLCNSVGIECDLVCGVAEGEGHMWNVVNIDGVHSYVDVTWNDRSEYKSYLYFNLTKAQIEYDHEFAPLHKDLTYEQLKNSSFNFIDRDATFTGNTYYQKYGFILSLDYAKPAADKIVERCASGIKTAEFIFTSKTALSEFQKSNMEFISNIQKYLLDIKIKSYAFERDVLILYYDYK